MGSSYWVRKYGEKIGDWQMVSDWWAAHTSERAIAETILPPVGVVVESDGEPVAALWCHLSAGIGVAFLESPVSKPGLSLSEASAIFKVGIEAIESICRAHDYGVLFTYTLPGITAWLERRAGFIRCGDRAQLVKRL